MQQAKAWTEKNLDAILATAAEHLVGNDNITAASILTNAVPVIRPDLSDFGYTAPASASGATVVECPVVFDQTQRTEAVYEEVDSAAGHADHLR